MSLKPGNSLLKKLGNSRQFDQILYFSKKIKQVPGRNSEEIIHLSDMQYSSVGSKVSHQGPKEDVVRAVNPHLYFVPGQLLKELFIKFPKLHHRSHIGRVEQMC